MDDLPERIFPHRPKIVYMGTPNFSVPALKALVESRHNVVAAVTQPDRPKGRGRKVVPSPVKQASQTLGIEVLQPSSASAPQFVEKMDSLAPDVLIVVAFGQILKRTLLDIPHFGVLNIHASLLPKYRGAAPIQWAILNNEATTGLTAMRMEEGLDSGPILLQESVPILPDETAGRLHDRLALLTGPFLIRTLTALANKRLRERPQEPGAVTYAPKIDRGMSLITWDRPAETVSALVRALDPWPGAVTMLKGRRIKLFSSQVVDVDRVGLPGRVTGQGAHSLDVETGKGIVRFRELQLPGKKRLPAKQFLKGFSVEKGTVLGA
jgi:methionyl-tRNA formyltransferase